MRRLVPGILARQRDLHFQQGTAAPCASLLPQGSAVNKRLLLDLGKYVLAAGLLVWVVRSNWAPPPNKAVATLAASSVGLCASPGGYGPLVAASAAVPDRIEPRGLGYVWKRHVVQRQPIHFGFLAAALL